jgi:hypothetical protein
MLLVNNRLTSINKFLLAPASGRAIRGLVKSGFTLGREVLAHHVERVDGKIYADKSYD